MDYEITFDQEDRCYCIYTDYEFSAIAEWVMQFVKETEDIQRVLSSARLAGFEKETTQFQHGPFDVVISEEGVAVSRQVDICAAEEEIKVMFDSQDSFYRVSTDGLQAKCGLEDLVDMIENWHNVLQ